MDGIMRMIAAIILWGLVVLFTFGLGLILLLIWALLVFYDSARREQKAFTSLRTTLMPGEDIVESALQHRVFALFSRRVAVAITNSRVVFIRRGLIGGFKMVDIQWKDLSDARIEQNVLSGICGSNLRFVHLSAAAPNMAVSGVPSGTAAKIYSRAQLEEQAWEEKRRVRTIEEVRAAAGGVVVNTTHAASRSDAKTEGAGNRVLSDILKAKELLDMGAVSDAEFQEMKAKILSGANASTAIPI